MQTPAQDGVHLTLLDVLWPGLAQPLLRLLVSMTIGILIANTLEALSWERYMARLAAPLVRLSHMGESAGASFVMAFFSAHASAGILTAAYAENKISKKELILSNLFNSLPSYLVHLPSVAAIAVSILGKWGLIYIALGLSAALLRTLGTALVSHFMLSKPDCPLCGMPTQQERKLNTILQRIFGTFKRRLLRVLKYTVPIYIAFFFIQYWGGFDVIQNFLSKNASFLSFLKPEAMTIVVMNIATETSASMSAAASLLHSGTLSGRDIVLAMLAGNILSSPVRAFRHQLPVYAGYYPAQLAAFMVLCNQAIRTLSLVLIITLYYIF